MAHTHEAVAIILRQGNAISLTFPTKSSSSNINNSICRLALFINSSIAAMSCMTGIIRSSVTVVITSDIEVGVESAIATGGDDSVGEDVAGTDTGTGGLNVGENVLGTGGNDDGEDVVIGTIGDGVGEEVMGIGGEDV